MSVCLCVCVCQCVPRHTPRSPTWRAGTHTNVHTNFVWSWLRKHMQIKKAFRKKTFYKNALLTFYFTAHGLGARGTPTRARALRLSGAPARAQRTPPPGRAKKESAKTIAHRTGTRSLQTPHRDAEGRESMRAGVTQRTRNTTYFKCAMRQHMKWIVLATRSLEYIRFLPARVMHARPLLKC